MAEEDALQADLNNQTLEAETVMQTNKDEADNIEGDVNALLERLAESTVQDVMDSINESIDEFRGQQETYYDLYILAQESFNALAKQKIAAEAARTAS